MKVFVLVLFVQLVLSVHADVCLNPLSEMICPGKNLVPFTPTKTVTFRLSTRSHEWGLKKTYTEEYINYEDQASLDSSSFNPFNPTIVVIHGFLNQEGSTMDGNLKKAYLDNHNVNYVSVGWGSCARTACYNHAVGCVPTVGIHVANFLDFILGSSGKWRDLTIVGHSLGAHIAGFAGRNTHDGQVGRIFGLDPAAPYFSDDAQSERRLASGSADYVECIHTNWECFGLQEPYCDIDFYPNGGAVQPGCSRNAAYVCDHSRAHELFAQTIKNSNAYVGSRCEHEDYFTDRGRFLAISSGDRRTFGGFPGLYKRKSDFENEIFYFKTQGTSPFFQINGVK